MSARNNREFLKVLNILQNDPELRPLIFEHEALLKALKDMGISNIAQLTGGMPAWREAGGPTVEKKRT